MWTVDDLELWMLAKMRGPRVDDGLVQLGCSTDDTRDTAETLGEVFDKPGHAAAEYRRILGAPHATCLGTTIGTFAGSFRHEYALLLWPDVVEHPAGYAWGYGFEGGPTSLPAEFGSVEPWRWTAERLRREATYIEILEEWSFDLDLNLTFASGARFQGRFDMGRRIASRHRGVLCASCSSALKITKRIVGFLFCDVDAQVDQLSPSGRQ